MEDVEVSDRRLNRNDDARLREVCDMHRLVVQPRAVGGYDPPTIGVTCRSDR
jgi:hypothetical protein